MLCYKVNSLDTLDKLKEANCYALEEANKIVPSLAVFDSYSFF